MMTTTEALDRAVEDVREFLDKRSRTDGWMDLDGLRETIRRLGAGRPAVEAYAIFVNGSLDVRTIYGSTRGAMINGLVAVFSIAPLVTWSDERVGHEWAAAVRTGLFHGLKVEVRPVEIVEPVSEIKETGGQL